MYLIVSPIELSAILIKAESVTVVVSVANLIHAESEVHSNRPSTEMLVVVESVAPRFVIESQSVEMSSNVVTEKILVVSTKLPSASPIGVDIDL